jgi:hypothetical protein
MAAFVFKRTGYPPGPRGRKGTISDAAMASILSAYRNVYGQVVKTPATAEAPAVMRDMTDDEVTDKIFDGIIQGLAEQGNANAKITAAKAAEAGVSEINVVVAADNV